MIFLFTVIIGIKICEQSGDYLAFFVLSFSKYPVTLYQYRGLESSLFFPQFAEKKKVL